MIDKQQILDLVAQHGTPDQLAQATQALPAQVDPTQLTQYAQLIGLDPQLFVGLAAGLDPANLVDQASDGDIGQTEGLLSQLLGRWFG